MIRIMPKPFLLLLLVLSGSSSSEQTTKKSPLFIWRLFCWKRACAFSFSAATAAACRSRVVCVLRKKERERDCNAGCSVGSLFSFSFVSSAFVVFWVPTFLFIHLVVRVSRLPSPSRPHSGLLDLHPPLKRAWPLPFNQLALSSTKPGRRLNSRFGRCIYILVLLIVSI